MFKASLFDKSSKEKILLSSIKINNLSHKLAELCL